MSTPLMISVAGVRGIVGETLTPPVISRFASAFSLELPAGPVVMGRDARRSGPMVAAAVTAGVTGAGRDLVDLGLATTPTTQLAVEHLRAAGGIIVTASHNPAPWNALKFLSDRGEFLGPQAGGAVRRRYESDRSPWVGSDRLGSARSESGALDWHLERVRSLSVIDLERIRRRGLRVVVDGCASVGGVAVPRLLRELGAVVVELDCVPNGEFTRELEPLPEHLGALGAMVRSGGADFGVAVDPDSDRAAFVDAAGVPLGEEFTVALGTRVVLERKRGPVVTNLSTSRILEAVCRDAQVPLYRTPVGEAHVVARMREIGAVAGGEGNGGMILPEAHLGRDGLVAVALIAQALAASGRTLRELAGDLPVTSMVKAKFGLGEEPWEQAAARLSRVFGSHQRNDEDGLRFTHDEEWVHVRRSGTEPVVRVIAESPRLERTQQLIETARRALTAQRAEV